jgi:Protein of unknown function (DUF992)
MFVRTLAVGSTLTATALGQVTHRVGLLSCDVSAGVGLILIQKQAMSCVFRPDGGGPPERYNGSISEYGLEIGAVAQGHLVWAVSAASQGAQAGTYAGMGADVAVVGGAGASALVGGTGRSVSLQPVSVETKMDVNVAAVARTVTLRPSGT